MRHSETTAGLSTVVKIAICKEKCLIPANLHFCKPNSDIKPLVDGQIRINTAPWKGNSAALGCLEFGAANVHVVLKSNTTERKPKRIEEMPIPQLALYNGRTEESVQYLLDYLEDEMLPREFFSLLHETVHSSPSGKPYRGYKLLVKGQKVSEIKKLTNKYRPVWYIFSCLGSQWPCVTKQLMSLEVFASSIRKSAEVLKPYGLDLIDLVTNKVNNEFNSSGIIQSLVSIAAVQVALVDVLNAIGISPDGEIGLSAGELGCAYADGCFTAEQTVLVAYWRAKVLEDSNLAGTGAMFVLDITWSQAMKCCPKDIFPVSHNASNSVTIAGLTDRVKEFVNALKAENVSSWEVDSCGYALHCPYIFHLTTNMQILLEKIIPNPKPRSSLWVSTTYPKEDWDKPSAKLASASYFVHSLVYPVLFCEALQHVPKDAIVIEIGPRQLLQAMLKREIGPDAEYISLMGRSADNTVQFLSSLGRLYTAGLNPDIEKLYPEVQFPAPQSRRTMTNPLRKWDHFEIWRAVKWDENTNQSQIIIEMDVDSEESSDKFVHCVDSRCLYTEAGLAIQWHSVGDVFVVQDTLGPNAVISGTVSPQINSCLTVLDKFLQQNHHVLSNLALYRSSETTNQKALKYNVLNAVGIIFGIKLTSTSNPETSLGELVLDSSMGVDVRKFLEQNFDLLLSIPKSRQLKVKYFMKLEGAVEKTEATTTLESRTIPTEVDSKIAEKFPAHLWSLSSKQLVPTETIIQMNSVQTGKTMSIVHPIQGSVEMLNSLAQLINFPVYGIQCTPETPSDSIKQLADWYGKHINTMNVSNTICLTGYSFGGTVAFEMCRQAESEHQQHAKVWNLIMLEASAPFMTACNQKHISFFRKASIEEVDVEVLRSYVLQFVNINMIELRNINILIKIIK